MRSHALALKESAILGERTAVWLASAYHSLEWTVTDRHGKNPVSISFDFMLANGKSLAQAPKLLALAKEAMFWIREHETEMSSAEMNRHWLVLRNIIHAVSLDHVKSLAEFSFASLLKLCQRLTSGVDSLLQASIRIDAFATSFAGRSSLPPECYTTNGLNLDEILRRCGIPKELKSTAEVGRAFARARKRFGFQSNRRESKRPKRRAESDVKTAGYLKLYRHVLRSLYDLRHLMSCETLLFDPRDAIDAAPKGRETETTKVVPDALGFGILEGSTRILIEEGAKTVAEHAEVSTARQEGRYDHEAAVTLRGRLQRLLCSCFVLILTFTGRRTSETLLLDDECLAGNDQYGWWLRVSILKKKKPVQTWIPVPGLIARVISLLKQLKGAVAAESGSKRLFMAFDPVLNRVVRLRPHMYLNEFAGELGLTSYTDGNGVVHEWPWESRQFRRFFAMLFFYRYGGSLETVSYALRHYNLETTRGYLAMERDLRNLYRMEEYRFRRRMMEDIANDNGEYSGPVFKRLKRYADGIKRVLRERLFVGTADQVDLMLQFATREKLVIRPKLWVNCCCPITSRAATKAKCQSANGVPTGPGPDPTNAGESVCGGCAWALKNRANERHLSRRLAEQSAWVDEDQPPANLYEHLQRANLVELRRFAPKVAA